jgi:hypothetical protein
VKIARAISIGMTALGAALAILGPLLDLSPVVTLTGMLLVVAGVVKIAIVAIWHLSFQLPHAAARAPHARTPAASRRSATSSEVRHEKQTTR